MKEFTITNGIAADIGGITDLYREVAAIEGGLARTADEISEGYVENFVTRAIDSGIIVIARPAGSSKIVGEIHGYALGPRVFAHVMGELTIAVDPCFQGVGVGKALFTQFMRLIVETRPDISRVELIARESNGKAIKFYEKLGFEIEGRLLNRIQSVGGGFESDIPMAWRRSTDLL